MKDYNQLSEEQKIEVLLKCAVDNKIKIRKIQQLIFLSDISILFLALTQLLEFFI